MAIKITLSDKKLLDNKIDAAVFWVEQDFKFLQFKDLAKQYCPSLERQIKDKKFTGKSNSILVAPLSNSDCGYFILIGLGKKDKKENLNFENYRRGIGNLVNLLKQYSIKSFAMELPDKEILGTTFEYIAKQTAITLQMADYVFDDFITDNDKIKEDSKAIIVASKDQVKKLQKSIDEGLIIADAVNSAREWVDLPSNLMTPADLSANAEKIAQEHGLECKIFHETEINKMGMGGISAVSSGSHKDAQLVIMKYHTKKKNAPTICFVGKGITFDSGGLSIKPAMHMETMKEDMSGAAAVIASMKAIAQLQPDVNIIAVAPIAENMPSGESVKPGDIVRFYNGKTAEIKNTDAEGRLILADAMSYAVKHFKIDAMIDLATLTGACSYALGPFFSGLFSEHEDFVQRVFEAANLSGDYVWRLPLTNDYKPAVKAEVADLSNTGRKEYQAGATTAACFLQHFVGDVPWVHLDIAGTAFSVPHVSYYKMHSATGAGVRLLVELAMNWNQKGS